MSRRPARCTQAEIRRAVAEAGPDRAVDILPDGTIRLTPIKMLALKATESPSFDEKRRIVL